MNRRALSVLSTVLVLATPGVSTASVQIAAGGEHTCALEVSGAVACWGANDAGQLGDGTTIDHEEPVGVVGLAADVTAIAAGSGHTCALMTSGAVRCWGANGGGQLGDGATTDRVAPVDVVGLSGVVAIAAGGAHTCAVLGTGSVKCWGWNFNGEVGDATTWTSSAWERPLPVDVANLSDAIGVVAGATHTCALTMAGGVKCWGRNVAGELGNGQGADTKVPVSEVAGLSNWVTALAAGARHTCALMTWGGVVCWGLNAFGALGDGTTITRREPVDVEGLGSEVVAIAAGADHTCAVRESGAVECWGDNEDGQLGVAGSGRSRPGGSRGPGGAISISAGIGHTCILESPGNVSCWGDDGHSP